MQNMFKKIFAIVFIASVFLSALSSSAYAHKVTVFAYVEDDTVFTESFFPDGKRVQGGKIEAYDENNKLLLNGVTNKEGQFNFDLPASNSIKIILDASMGHKDDFTLQLKGSAKEKDFVEKATRVPLKEIMYGLVFIFGIAVIAQVFLKAKGRKQ